MRSIQTPLTPMMQQYLDIKEQHKDYLLLYRLGDFYELFFDDAVIASKILDIVLTKRNKQEGEDIAMCGVPFHSADSYIQRLIKAGHKVAICEQLETPEEAKKRGYKAVVKREVVRIITPGTVIEDNLLESNIPNYIVALAEYNDEYAVAWVDISTGEFHVIMSSLINLSSDISRLNPKELLISEKLYSNNILSAIMIEWKSVLQVNPDQSFDYKKLEIRLKNFFNIADLSPLGLNNHPSLISACGALTDYINLTQKGNNPKLNLPTLLINSKYMVIDAATRRNLELISSINGETKYSLLNIIDRTETNIGARLLANAISMPLTFPNEINKRLSFVEFFVKERVIREKIRNYLKLVPDFERSLSRLIMNRGGPRDMQAIRVGLEASLYIAEILELSDCNKPNNFVELTSNLGGCEQIIAELKNALKDELPMLTRDGGFIKPDYNSKLDELHELQRNHKYHLDKLREKYRAETGINNLKIDHNNVIGYFVEVTAQNSSKINSIDFVHRQTMANTVRYTTKDLKELETALVNASTMVVGIEMQLFEELLNQIIANSDKVKACAEKISFIDFYCSLAELAVENNYTKPVVDNSKAFETKNGRHPVVEYFLKKQSTENFIANNCDLSTENSLWLLTGPNMAGKSTFLRQNAIICLLAQIGSYVPAEYAHIGVVDRLFSRVGAADNLARGQSTFMVEMIETATILNQATERSFIILDEIGRGTSTYDGLSIAWSCLEYLHNKIKARAIFATHYHELTELSLTLKQLACYQMKVKEWNGKIIFLHEIEKGASNRSYGIEVAKLAGLPKSVIVRAEEILINLVNRKDSPSTSITKPLEEVMPLFFSNRKEEEFKEDNLRKIIKSTDPNNLTPKAALEFIYKLKEEV